MQPVGQKLQLEGVRLAASCQVVVELRDYFEFSNSLHLRYEAAHEEVVVVVCEQGEILIGDGHRFTVGTRRSSFTEEGIF